MTTESIQFFPDNWQTYWPQLDVKCGYPHVYIEVSYTEDGTMIFERLSLPKREMLLFDYTKMPTLILETLKLVSQYNGISISLP